MGYYPKVKYFGTTLIDITDSTVAPETLSKDEIAYDAKGNKITGTLNTKTGPNSEFALANLVSGLTYVYSEEFQAALNNEELEDEELLTLINQYGVEIEVKDEWATEGELDLRDYAFANVFLLKTVHLSSAITKIPDDCFYCCMCTKNPIAGGLPENITEIGKEAFYLCNAMEKLGANPNYQSSALTEIGEHAYTGCMHAKIITIPDSVTKIGESAFFVMSDNALTIFCDPVTPPETGSYIFGSLAEGSVIYVPDESVDVYKEADGWKNYADNIKGISEYEGDRNTL